MEPLFTPITLGTLQLPNRIVMAPMTRCRALGNVANPLMARYYSQRADAGLIITEGTSPSPNGLGYARIPGMFSPEQIAGWKTVTDAVHAAGGRIFVQLMHTGRVGHPANLPPGARLLAPSPLAAPGEIWTDTQGMQPYPVPTEMTEDDIAATIEEVSVRCSALSSMPRTKLRSILMRWTISRRRFWIEAWPVPKSSRSIWNPAEARPRRLRTIRSSSLLISTVSSRILNFNLR